MLHTYIHVPRLDSLNTVQATTGKLSMRANDLKAAYEPTTNKYHQEEEVITRCNLCEASCDSLCCMSTHGWTFAARQSTLSCKRREY